MAKGNAGRLEVTVVGARGLAASRVARVELVLGGDRRVRTRPAPRGLVSGPRQLVEFGDWFSFPLDGEALALTVVGTRVGGKEVTLGVGEVQVSPLLTGEQEQASCSLLSHHEGASEFAGEVLLAVRFRPATGAPAVGIQVSAPGVREAPGHPVEPAAVQLGRAVERDIAELQSALAAVRLETAGQQANRSQSADAQGSLAGHQSEIARLAARISALEAERDDLVASYERLDHQMESLRGDRIVLPETFLGPSGWSGDEYCTSDTSSESESELEPEPNDLSGWPKAVQNAHRAIRDGYSSTGHPAESIREGTVDFWPGQWEFNPDDGFCGRRVRVLWKPEERRMQASGKTSRTVHSQWWGGFIAAMLPPSCGAFVPDLRARIHYDDGDIEILDLADGSSQWEFTDFGPGDVGRRLQVVAPDGSARTGKVLRCFRKRLPEFKLPVPVGPEEAHPAERACRNANGRFVSDAADVLFDGCDVSEPLNLAQENFEWLDENRRIQTGMTLDLIDTKGAGSDKAAWVRGRVHAVVDLDDGTQRVELLYQTMPRSPLLGEPEVPDSAGNWGRGDQGTPGLTPAATWVLSGEFPRFGDQFARVRHQWRALETAA